MLARLLAFSGAVILALPPGWCCFALNLLLAASTAADEPAPAAHACCRMPAAPPARDQQSPPAKPKASCCCQQDLSQPKGPDAGPEALPWVALVTAGPCGSIHVGLGADRLIVLDPSPPLQLLHCVWTC